MLSNEDLERLITVKRSEIEREKSALGLSPPQPDNIDNKENAAAPGAKKHVSITDNRVLSERNDKAREKNDKDGDISFKLEDNLPAGLERYIRRYIGLPVMLKAGEFSPNNPLTRGERNSGDVLLGLGEYERRRNTLRKLRQQEYREYLDEQAKKKQEAKQLAVKELRDREERERQHDEERERSRRLLEREKCSPEQRRASVCYVAGGNNARRNTVDTGVQVGTSQPLSVAVQTEHAELYRITPSPTKSQLTEAERELSPHTVVDTDDRPIQPAGWAAGERGDGQGDEVERRRRSYGDFDERTSTLKRSNREKLVSDLRHTYMPSIFDADAIQMRNLQIEKEAAERRQFYQKELKHQILEQQRIREERKTREKMLEQAEMRRLEEQLQMLRMAQERETGRQHDITAAMTENATDYEKKRTNLQMEIEFEQHKLLRAKTQPARNKRTTITTSHSDIHPNLPFYHPRLHDRSKVNNAGKKLPYSTNIPDNSIFSPNYDVDSYLRRNLNPNKEALLSNRFENHRKFQLNLDNIEISSDVGCENNVIVEEALVHERPKARFRIEKPKYEPSFLRKNLDEILSIDDTPIPVLRHSPRTETKLEEITELSDGMQLVDDKWKVPAVQKNILKSMPNERGRNVNILTQLGSIRRQLQLEQLKLDNNMISSRSSDV